MRKRHNARFDQEELVSGATSRKGVVTSKVILYRLVELLQLVMQIRSELDEGKLSIEERVANSITSSLSIERLQKQWITTAFKIRMWYLEQALSYYPELSRNLGEDDRKVTASLLRGRCLQSRLAEETRCRWKTVSRSLESLKGQDLVESKSVGKRRNVYCLKEEFAQKIGKALRTALMLG